MQGVKVFVTGGANGIGRDIVTAFHKAGAKVAFCDTDEEAGRELQVSLGEEVLFYRVDVTSEPELSDVLNLLFEKWGGYRCYYK